QVGASQNAAKDYGQVIELDPQRNEARRWLGLALLEFGRYQESLDHLEILHKQHPEDPEIRARLAQGRHRLGQDAEAYALLDGVLAEHPDHSLALFTRGQMDLEAERFAQAETWLRQAAHKLPYDYKAQWALGECLRRAGKTEEAEVQIARADQLKDLRQRQNE